MSKFIEFLKLIRPKFYNGITWTMVGSGIAMMTTPFWLEIVSALVKEKFNLVIIDEFNPIYGLSLVLIALIFNTVNLHLDQRANVTVNPILSAEENAQIQMKRDHDVELYRKESAILDQAQIDYFYNHVGAEHTCWDDDYRCLADLHDFSIKPENRYLDEGVLAQRDSLALACNKLSWFLVTHFFHFPDRKIDGRWQKALYPELNIDRGGSYEGTGRYDKYADELSGLLKELKATFKEYRIAIKETYIV